MSKCIYDNDGKWDITRKDCKNVILCTPENSLYGGTGL